MRSTLRYVDPHAERGVVYRSWCRLSATRIGLWLSRRFAWKLDPLLLKATRGRFGFAGPVSSAVLETHGARSGRVRAHAVLYFHDGDRITIIASKAGAPQHPAWYFNLVANPEVMFGGQPFEARTIEDDSECARLWQLADRVFPPFARYREHARESGRTIPIIQLVPRSGSTSSGSPDRRPAGAV